MQFILVLAIVCALLSAVFADSACEGIKNQSTCTSYSKESCAWCTSGAVGASCMSAADAAGLPSSIFTCTTASASASAVETVEPNLSAESPCAVAGYLRKAGFPSNSIGTMVCIAKWESSYNCGATNHNTDGSTDYGLFEINSYYWCSGDSKSKYNECNASCSSLLNCQANANCAYKVFKEQGYNAWYGYKAHKAECDSAPAPC